MIWDLVASPGVLIMGKGKPLHEMLSGLQVFNSHICLQGHGTRCWREPGSPTSGMPTKVILQFTHAWYLRHTCSLLSQAHTELRCTCTIVMSQTKSATRVWWSKAQIPHYSVIAELLWLTHLCCNAFAHGARCNGCDFACRFWKAAHFCKISPV